MRAGRPLFAALSLLSLLSLVACGGGDDADTGIGPGGGGASGSGGGGSAGTAGSGGESGTSGSGGTSGTSGSGGTAGNAGTDAGSGGESGTSGSGGTDAGSGGESGTSGSGGTDAGSGGESGTSGSGGTDAGSGGTAGSGGSVPVDPCPTGTPCDEGSGTCLDGACCQMEALCGSACCGAGTVCSFLKCEVPGATCIDRTDCADNEYCEYSLGEQSSGNGAGGQCVGANVKTGRCLPAPPLCPDGSEPAPGDLSCLSKCEVHPPTTNFEPALKYYWGGKTTSPYASDVMMAPIVVQLDDDNCDGKVNENDIPEIVFSTFTGGGYTSAGDLYAISIVNGQIVEKLHLSKVVHPSGGLAAADLDGDGVPEIVGCMAPAVAGNANTGVFAIKADGSVLWQQTDTTKVHCGNDAPAIADPWQTGNPTVLVGFTLLDGKTGAVLKELDPTHGAGNKINGFADIDGDGMLDIVNGQRVYRADGSLVWDLRGANGIPAGFHAVGDLNGDGKPEVVVISSGGPHTAAIITHDPDSPTGAKIIRKGIDINNGVSTASYCGVATEYGGGPPTIADFNGDGVPDIGVAGAVGYIVLDGIKLMNPDVPNNQTKLWFKQTRDCSSAVTGSSVFDFNGDGKAEVLYSDEYNFWMYDGETGENLIPSMCNTTGTLAEYPLVADVDNDGQADIIVASNAYSKACNGTKQSGIRIFGSATGSWVRTRRIWNQHSYHVTNIGEDGRVPVKEKANWLQPGLNNFRQNVQPEGEFAAPDLVATVSPLCGEIYGLTARVRNIGQAAAPPGVPVSFFLGDPADGHLLGIGATTKTLYPAESESVSVMLPDAPIALRSGQTFAYVVVDDAVPDHTWRECRTNNNTASGNGSCKE